MSVLHREIFLFGRRGEGEKDLAPSVEHTSHYANCVIDPKMC